MWYLFFVNVSFIFEYYSTISEHWTWIEIDWTFTHNQIDLFIMWEDTKLRKSRVRGAVFSSTFFLFLKVWWKSEIFSATSQITKQLGGSLRWCMWRKKHFSFIVSMMSLPLLLPTWLYDLHLLTKTKRILSLREANRWAGKHHLCHPNYLKDYCLNHRLWLLALLFGTIYKFGMICSWWDTAI